MKGSQQALKKGSDYQNPHQANDPHSNFFSTAEKRKQSSTEKLDMDELKE